MARCAAERGKLGGLEDARAVVHYGVYGDSARSVFDHVHADIDVYPVHALNRDTLEVPEGVVADSDPIEGVVENAGVGAYRARYVVEYAVLNENVFAVQILGAAVDDVLRVENVELDSLISVMVRSENLIAEGAARRGEAVAARYLHHVTLALVDNGDVFHREVLRVGNLEHGVLAVVAVVGAADEPDVLVLIADSARVHLILVSYSEHIARKGSPERNAAEVERRVVVDFQTPAEVVAARSRLDGHRVRGCSLILRLIESGLERPLCAVAQVRSADVDDLRACVSVVRRGSRCRDSGERHQR